MDENDLIAKTVEKALDSEPVKNLLGPVTQELGLIGDDIGSILRFYVNRNLRRIFTKWAEQRNEKPLPPDTDMGKLMPLLQLASMQDNDELQERWAALLDNAVKTPDGVLPSFGQTLSQLTAQEARYVHHLYVHVEAKRKRGFNNTLELGRENDLLGLYDERLRAMSYARAEQLKKELGQAQLAIDDVKRLGIIAERQEIGRLNISERDIRSIGALSTKIQDTELESVYSLTEYGVSFVRAVTPARDIDAEMEQS
jgi:hypothetical protein